MSLFIRRRKNFKTPLQIFNLRNFSTIAPNADPKSNLSARLSFVFDQIDIIDNQTSEKFDALQKIRQWRENRGKKEEHSQNLTGTDSKVEYSKDQNGTLGHLDRNLFENKRNVELVHPWPEWIELTERLGQQNYFGFMKDNGDNVAENDGIDPSEVKEDFEYDFSRDWIVIRKGFMNFGRDRFDILRSLSKNDIRILVAHGCPSMDSKVVFSAKLLRKYTHLDEGDVCSSCNLRNSCSRGYILTHKEDEARTIDVMRVLLTYGFDHVKGTVENKPLMQMKPVKTVVRKLLHEIVKLSAVPIDPNLPPPVIKKPPPKVKLLPPQPKKRVGRDDVEMKKGDWLCTKCDFLNFAKNTVCLQCDAKRPKRQLLPGEWECPQCNFLNYRRNMACFHCDAKRPPDEYTENQLQEKQLNPRMKFVRDHNPDLVRTRAQDISNAWNFDFDDNESDGADVAAFEFADPTKGKSNGPDVDDLPHERRRDSMDFESRNPRAREGPRYFSDDDERKTTEASGRTGFDDFDDEEDDVDSYVLDGTNDTGRASDVPKRSFSELEDTSDSEELESFDRGSRNYNSESEDELADHPRLKSSHVADAWNKTRGRGRRSQVTDDDDDDDDDSGFGYKQRKARQQSMCRKGISGKKDLLLDSDSDGDDMSYSSRHRMSGNKDFAERRGRSFNKSSRRDDYGSGRSDSFERADKFNNGNKRRGGSNDFSDRPTRGYGSRRGSDGYGSGRGSDSFERADKFNNGNKRRGGSNDFSDRPTRGPRREGGRFGDNDDKFNGKNRRDERTNQFSDGSRGSRRGNGRFEDFDGYGNGSRKQDRSRGAPMRNGRGESSSNYGDRSGNFDNGGDSGRTRRVIER